MQYSLCRKYVTWRFLSLPNKENHPLSLLNNKNYTTSKATLLRHVLSGQVYICRFFQFSLSTLCLLFRLPFRDGNVHSSSLSISDLLQIIKEPYSFLFSVSFSLTCTHAYSNTPVQAFF